MDITAHFKKDDDDWETDADYENTLSEQVNIKCNLSESTRNVRGRLYLQDVIDSMQTALIDKTTVSVKSVLTKSRTEWMYEDPAQVTIVVNQLQWALGVEKALDELLAGGGPDGAEPAHSGRGAQIRVHRAGCNLSGNAGRRCGVCG